MGTGNSAVNLFHGSELSVTLFEEAGDALFLFDPDSEEIYEANPMVQRLSGFTRAELLGQQITYLFRSENQGGLQRLRTAFKKTGPFQSQEGFLLRHREDEVWIPVNLTVTRLHMEPKILGLMSARDVRENREISAQLQKVDAELRRVLTCVSDYIWSGEIDGGGRLTYRYYSPVVEQITGRPPEYYMDGPERWLATIHPEDCPRMHQILAHIQSGRSSREEAEYRILWPDGRLRWVRDCVQISPGADGQSLRLDGVVTDITDRKQAEEALRASEERFRTLVEKSADAMALVDSQAQIIYASPSTLRVLGFTAEEFVGRNALADVHPDDLPGVQEKFVQCLAEPGQDIHAEFRYRHKDGSWRYLEGTGNNRLSEPAVRAIVFNYHDVTERQRVEEAIRASEAKYRSLIENLDQNIFLKDRDLRFVAANRKFCQLLGLAEDQIVGKSDLDFYPRHLAEKYQADDRLVLTEGRRLELEEQNLSAGQLRTVRVVKTPVKDDQGLIVGVLGIFWDVSEQRVLEAQLRQAQKMEAVGQLAGGVAHDFNNLLTVILGNVSLIQSGEERLKSGATPGVFDGRAFGPDASPRPSRTPGVPPSADRNAQLLAEMERAAFRAAELTHKLLGFSRRTALRLEPTDLNTAIEEMTGLLRRTIDPRIILETHKSTESWPVQADVAQINQVLINLCLNARDAMPEGGRLLLESQNLVFTEESVRGHLEARPGEFVRLRVSDTGHGIPPEILPRIFEPFFTTKGPGRGTGLGLAMVFGIIKQHQGWIACASRVNEGACFDIFLPRSRLAPVTQAPPPAARLPSHGRETVLLVDDESMIRNLGRAILQSYGYRVLLAEDGVQALDMYRAQKGQIDLVVLDLTMPRLSGQHAFRRLLEVDPKVRVLFASGYSAEQINDLKSDRILGFIGKPYRPEDLAHMVRTALDAAKAMAAKLAHRNGDPNAEPQTPAVKP
jgi:PAS domain S-box-containing protein